jgi:DNA-binding transcriptional regulator YhcF (GntR family)
VASASVQPAYVRIASDLRRRIRETALRPGQRVPSTRRLAKMWKVALATASKALGVLAHEGAITAVPRVGYVVAGPASSRAKPERGDSLGRASIVEVAVDIADREGLAALSMRGVAAKMGVPVTSLYRHVASKEDLLGFMVDRAVAEETHPDPKGAWRTRIEVGARLEWRLMRRHPWVARVMTLTRPIPSEGSLAHAEWMLRALEESGVDAETMMKMHVTIYGFVQGLATNVESEAQAQGDTGLDEDGWMDTRTPEFVKMAETGAFPTFARVVSGMPGGFDLDLDSVFEFGLARILDGFERLAGTKTRRRD